MVRVWLCRVLVSVGLYDGCELYRRYREVFVGYLASTRSTDLSITTSLHNSLEMRFIPKQIENQKALVIP